MKKFIYSLCLCVAVCLGSCKDDPKFEDISWVSTDDASQVTRNSALLSGNYNYSSGYKTEQVGSKGFYLSTSPTFDSEDTQSWFTDDYYWRSDSYIEDWGHSFTFKCTGLKENTTYYFYACIRHRYGNQTIKGEVKSFTTQNLVAPEGAIRSVFYVDWGSRKKPVFFSKGNLQYQASTNTWRFAEHQYDYIGNGNANASASYSGWIDLFGWGTSGYAAHYPYMTSTTYSDYILWNSIAKTSFDWGVYNAISNGGNQAGKWRTLTDDEWGSVLSSCSGKSRATVCGVHGYVLLPEYFEQPAGISWSSAAGNWTTNTYDAQAWLSMENAGAVFLPAAGYRSGTSVYDLGTEGRYWSSTRSSGEGPQFRRFSESISIQGYYYYLNGGYNGGSVRLVQDYQ